MKFYVINSASGEVRDCKLTLREARAEAEKWHADEGYSIDAVEVDVTADNIRRLLGNCGQYAKSMKTVVSRLPQVRFA